MSPHLFLGGLPSKLNILTIGLDLVRPVTFLNLSVFQLFTQFPCCFFIDLKVKGFRVNLLDRNPVPFFVFTHNAILLYF